MRKIRDVPLVPVSANGGDKLIRSAAPAGSYPTETAGVSGVDNPHSADETELPDAPQDTGACSAGGDRGSKLFDQMQLDMICLDWQSEVLERQHQQVVLQAQRQSKAERKGETQGAQELQSTGSPSAVLSNDCSQQLAPSAPSPVARSVLDQTVELAFHTLNLPEDILKRNEGNCDLQVVLRRLRSLLCFRLRTSEASGPRGESADGDRRCQDLDDQRPRRVFFVSQGVKRLVEALGSSRYKIVNGGCLAFQARCKGVYRVSYGGAQWLAPFYETAMRLVTPEGRGFPEAPPSDTGLVAKTDALSIVSGRAIKRFVFFVPCKLLYLLVSADQDKRRVDICKIAEVPFGDTLIRESSEGPLLFLARVPCPADEAGCSFTNIAVRYRAM